MSIIDKIKKTPAKKKATKKVDAATETVASTSTAPDAKKAQAMHVVLRAMVTEKAAVMQSVNKYTFLVTKSATKNQIKHAIEALHGVKPSQVHIINVQGKAKRYGRSAGRRSDFKKAVITLPKGHSIVIHEGV